MCEGCGTPVKRPRDTIVCWKCEVKMQRISMDVRDVGPWEVLILPYYNISLICLNFFLLRLKLLLYITG